MPDRRPYLLYLPAVVCAEFDSPVDALRSLCVPHDEAMDLVAASWQETEADEDDGAGRGHAGNAIVTTIDGGRYVAALPLANGRWAGCQAYPEHASATRADAERLLLKLARGKKRGLIGVVDVRYLRFSQSSDEASTHLSKPRLTTCGEW